MSSLASTLQRAWLRRGPLACALWPVSCLMGMVVALRRLASARGWLHADKLPVPVLVVGNRIVGGAGKTPVTIAILQHLQARGLTPGVLSRGYGVTIDPAQPRLLDRDSVSTWSARDTGDEPWLIFRRTGVPVMVGPKRAVDGRALLRAHPDIDILVCDDGLQHLALQRDIEVVVFDERGAGNGWLLPAGPLREPLDTAAGPGVTAPPLVLYNAARPSTPLPGHVGVRELGDVRALADWWAGTQTTPAPSPQATPGAWALAGIAHPDRFFDALRAQGWQLQTCPLPDHHGFATLPWPAEVRDLIVTEKDAVKLDPQRLALERPNTRVWVSVLDFRPEPAFWTALDAAIDAVVCAAQPPRRPNTVQP
ncbi:lipid-A-disaccharide kinase [Aquabacterium commune]|uniref:Tetraacyldisaccharide 4'-kinase n=1 Tax=Aquabacterium commune TaxID=70586 RepID=A0A4V3CW09_9BURK|nr:tetraacyldisaccharide 4'-kinase [Aquabacterium commune]TDP84548.1 lipid-A-disaccharide kinase [Aquabacterium commune]